MSGAPHLDALGRALQVGDQVEHDYSPRGAVTITELLPGGRCFAFKRGNRTEHAVCCGYVRVSAGCAA